MPTYLIRQIALLVLLLVPVQFAHAQLIGRYVRLILDTSYLHSSEMIVWKPGELGAPKTRYLQCRRVGWYLRWLGG